MTWYPAYFLAVCLVFQLFMVCALGTVVEFAVSLFQYYKLRMTHLLVENQLFNIFPIYFIFRIKNDRLNYTVLQTNFYLLPLHLQRDFKFMIHIVQQAQYLKVGSAAKLDVALFVLVMNSFLFVR